MNYTRPVAGILVALLVGTAAAADDNKIISAGMEKTEAAACTEAQASMKQLTAEMKDWTLIKQTPCQCHKSGSGYFCSVESFWRLQGFKG